MKYIMGLPVVLALLLVIDVGTGATQSEAYRVVFYPSGLLRIQGYLYNPPGQGPFPVVIYNHGSREGQERTEVPFRYVGAFLSQAGYEVFVPERRGYGRSDGPTFSEEIGRDVGAKFIARMQAETDDVLAAVSFLGTIPEADTKRMAIMGWSLGGIVTVFASSRGTAFRAVVDQAGGALTWNHSPSLQAALQQAVRQIRVPVLLMDAENDSTTDAVTTLAKILQEANRTEQLRIYPPYYPPSSVTALAQKQGIALGHLIFGADGVSLWQGDVVSFLDRYMK